MSTKFPMGMNKSEFAKHAAKIVNILQDNIEKKELEIQVKNILIRKLVHVIEENKIELPKEVQSVLSQMFIKPMITEKDLNDEKEENKKENKENENHERSDIEKGKDTDPETPEGKSEFEKAKEKRKKQTSGFARIEKE